MSEFFRFPHTPHLVWLGEGNPRDDKVLSAPDAQALLAGDVVVEEKLDGANLGLSLSTSGELLVQNRGQYLEPPYRGQFERLGAWLAARTGQLFGGLHEGVILFGEWCAARHSLAYDRLPDWFVAFDVYDRAEWRFWSTTRRDALAAAMDIEVVPPIFRGKVTAQRLVELVNTRSSAFRAGPLEGVVIRAEVGEWLSARAKLVRAEFTQAIGDHWRRRSVTWNRLEALDGRAAARP
ncbi:MAG: RNA ligase family protein [Deferrisomatales bacterium]